jgi:hypothetical protein
LCDAEKITIMAKTLVAKNSNEGDVASVVGSGEGCNWWKSSVRSLESSGWFYFGVFGRNPALAAFSEIFKDNSAINCINVQDNKFYSV